MRGVRRCATVFKLHCFVVSVCKDVYSLSTALGPQSLGVTEPLIESNESHVQVRFKLRLLRAALIQRQLTHLRGEPPMVKMSLPNFFLPRRTRNIGSSSSQGRNYHAKCVRRRFVRYGPCFPEVSSPEADMTRTAGPQLDGGVRSHSTEVVIGYRVRDRGRIR